MDQHDKILASDSNYSDLDFQFTGSMAQHNDKYSQEQQQSGVCGVYAEAMNHSDGKSLNSRGHVDYLGPDAGASNHTMPMVNEWFPNKIFVAHPVAQSSHDLANHVGYQDQPYIPNPNMQMVEPNWNAAGDGLMINAGNNAEQQLPMAQSYDHNTSAHLLQGNRLVSGDVCNLVPEPGSQQQLQAGNAPSAQYQQTRQIDPQLKLVVEPNWNAAGDGLMINAGNNAEQQLPMAQSYDHNTSAHLLQGNRLVSGDVCNLVPEPGSQQQLQAGNAPSAQYQQTRQIYPQLKLVVEPNWNAAGDGLMINAGNNAEQQLPMAQSYDHNTSAHLLQGNRLVSGDVSNLVPEPGSRQQLQAGNAPSAQYQQTRQIDLQLKLVVEHNFRFNGAGVGPKINAGNNAEQQLPTQPTEQRYAAVDHNTSAHLLQGNRLVSGDVSNLVPETGSQQQLQTDNAPSASYPSGITEKQTRQIKQRLELIRHAYKCNCEICKVKYCKDMKAVLSHMKNCNYSKDCPTKLCASTRKIIMHYTICCSLRCVICYSCSKKSCNVAVNPANQVTQEPRQQNVAYVPQFHRGRKRTFTSMEGSGSFDGY